MSFELKSLLAKGLVERMHLLDTGLLHDGAPDAEAKSVGDRVEG